ncbi:MAG: hypothetical protein KDB01_18740 [Planctomycetaceae bacterium]|nr:hypothetical protein [Planctomycetaceae bacterium]
MNLNQNVSWMDLPEFVRSAFQTKFTMPTKDILQSGTVLYKFNDFPTLHGPSNSNLSPWWSPYAPYKHDAGWEQKLRMAKSNGVSVREWGRLTSAVKENWNSLNYLLVITLGVPAYGFFGGFAQMERIDPGTTSKMGGGERKGGSKNLPGGATQLYIPNLTADHVSSWKVQDLSNF